MKNTIKTATVYYFVRITQTITSCRTQDIVISALL